VSSRSAWPTPSTPICGPARSRSSPEIEVLSKAKELPLPVFGEPDYPEDVRLKYRFLDLRRETLHANIITRTKVIADDAQAHDRAVSPNMQTPILTASSPEGARDFLVPSRIHPGKFYALPQAPQQYKQLLMVRASTATSRSRRASATKTRAPTGCRANSTSSTSR
jgi:aspartyl/asparaginyl-tRNA synthetase